MSTTEELRDAILAQEPTAEQQGAIFAGELEFLLRAAPGSGKAWTSCRRFIWRGANWPYSVGGLALLSFTNVAIREFKSATIEVGRRDLLSDPNYVGTFDSFVERYILAPFGHLLAGASKRPVLFPGPRPGDWNNKKLQAWTEVQGRKRPVPAWEIIPYPDDKKLRFKTSRNYGNKTITIQGPNPVQRLLSLGFYTHSQRVFWAFKLLSDRPYIAELLARRFPEIIVDEAQDTNAWLLILLNFLRRKGAKITLIGDPDQCIFEFSMADATSLLSLREKWDIPEKPLSQSFRCNNQIANAVRNVGGNEAFTGCSDAQNERHRAFVVRETSKEFSDSVSAFKELLADGALDASSAAIICRAHEQLESIRGHVSYTKLKGKTKELATAAFLRDMHQNYRKAFQIVERVVREMTGADGLWDRVAEEPDSCEAHATKLAIWQFVKDLKRLPSLSQNGGDWIKSLRANLTNLLANVGIQSKVKIGTYVRKTGLDTNQLAQPLFKPKNDFPRVRQDTIHQVKGESIDSVLVIGSAKFWNSVVKAIDEGDNTEDRRLAYVALTRARHQLVVGLPKSHFDKNIGKWRSFGFAAHS